LPTESRFLQEGPARVIVYTTTRSSPVAIDWLQAQGAEVIVHDDRRVGLAAMLADLAAAGIARLMVEGGSTIVAALLERDLVDELQLAVAPLLFGGETAPTPVGGTGLGRDQAVRLRLLGANPGSDDDVVLRYSVIRDGVR
jgi:riboflavin biosynthesis pyrimidine reductase